MTNSQLTGKYTIIAPGEIVSRNIEMKDGEVTAIITYDEGTVVEITMNSDDVNLNINKPITVNTDDGTIKINNE